MMSFGRQDLELYSRKEIVFFTDRALMNRVKVDPRALYSHRFKNQSATNSQKCTHAASHDSTATMPTSGVVALWSKRYVGEEL